MRKAWHQRPVTVGKPTDASKHLPHIHRPFANSKTWRIGTDHGVSPKHLPYYVDEFVFSFNRRQPPIAAFRSRLELTGQYQPTTGRVT